MDNNYIFQYWAAIENGTVTVGKWIRTIYKILVDGLKSGKWDYDEGKAEKAIKFIENFCHHSEGRNDLLKLELWQKAIVSAIFGIMDKKTGYRQFREVFIVVARKNGKTLFAAAIAGSMGQRFISLHRNWTRQNLYMMPFTRLYRQMTNWTALQRNAEVIFTSKNLIQV